MKLEVRENHTIQLEEVFNGIVIKTTGGVEFHICQRDYGIEVTCNGKTKYLDEETFNLSGGVDFIPVIEQVPPLNTEVLAKSPEGEVFLTQWRDAYDIFTCQSKGETSWTWSWKLI